MSWIFLSYTMSPSMSAYGEGAGLKVTQGKDMCHGDTCNTINLAFPNHFGTHMDYPFHFSLDGAHGDNYRAEDFVFDHIQYVELGNAETNKSRLYSVEDLKGIDFDPKSEVVLFNFGFWKIRKEKDYVFSNPSFHPEVAKFLKEKMPHLRMIVMDSISLNSWNSKEIGREAHKKFLVDHKILIVEDADFSQLSARQLKKLIIAPLRYEKADGTPVTILAEV